MFKRLLRFIFAPRTAADELRGMSDYELKDLGIGRSQVEYFCDCERKPVLDQPPCRCGRAYIALNSCA
jgi:hypothetical protein